MYSTETRKLSKQTIKNVEHLNKDVSSVFERNKDYVHYNEDKFSLAQFNYFTASINYLCRTMLREIQQKKPFSELGLTLLSIDRELSNTELFHVALSCAFPVIIFEPGVQSIAKDAFSTDKPISFENLDVASFLFDNIPYEKFLPTLRKYNFARELYIITDNFQEEDTAISKLKQVVALETDLDIQLNLAGFNYRKKSGFRNGRSFAELVNFVENTIENK